MLVISPSILASSTHCKSSILKFHFLSIILIKKENLETKIKFKVYLDETVQDLVINMAAEHELGREEMLKVHALQQAGNLLELRLTLRIRCSFFPYWNIPCCKHLLQQLSEEGQHLIAKTLISEHHPVTVLKTIYIVHHLMHHNMITVTT